MQEKAKDGLYLGFAPGVDRIDDLGQAELRELINKRAQLRVCDISALETAPVAENLEELAPETVIRDDDRVPIYETEHAPWRMICALRMKFGTKTYIGTGWLAGPLTVVTAAHNLYHRKLGWCDEVEVIPGYDRGEKPYGSQKSSRFFVTEQWRTDLSPDHDIGAISLSKQFDPFPGHFGVGVFEDSVLSDMSVHISGYPLHTYPKSLSQPFLANGRILYHHTNVIAHQAPLRLYYTADTSGGNSGSPVWVREKQDGPAVVIGIHAYGYDPEIPGPSGRYNSSPRINTNRFNLIADLVRRDTERADAAERGGAL